MVEIAKKEKADAIAHGATGKGNDQVRFELTAAALAPELAGHRPVARRAVPQRISRPRGDDRLLREAKASPCRPARRSRISMDRNLLHISYEAGILEDPWFDAGDLKNRDYFTALRASPRTRRTSRSTSRSISRRATASP